MEPRHVAILAFEGVQSLDVTGPLEVFHTAGRLREGAYRVDVVAPGGGEITSSSGLPLKAGSLPTRHAGLDTLIVAGGSGVRHVDDATVRWVREAAGAARRTCSVCTGAYLLARAGLLDGRRATTHWAHVDRLAAAHPPVTVERDPIFVRDGAVATSAGVTAGMDLALALVEEDLGPPVALEVARWLVLFVKRPGGQAQFSAALAAQTADRAPLRELQAWIADHVGDDLSVPALAARAQMSERTFARAFRREVGVTPAAYVEAARVERARAALETSTAPVDAIARSCGFGTVETMRRAFHRRLGVGPAAYRSRFRPVSAA